MPEDVTFFSKEEITCPVCGTNFHREELLTGRGRLNAGKLTEELRRLYIPTQKYGAINPLIYPVTVCPNCLFASADEDFEKLPPKVIPKVAEYRDVRAKYLVKIFGRIPDYTQKRDLVAGTASYILAISSYGFFDARKFSPTIKRGIYALRTAWLMRDLLDQTKDNRYQELSEVFYKKAAEFYELAMERQAKAIEPLESCRNLGPDTDHNYGYQGVLYVLGMLKYKMSLYIEDPYEKIKVYEEVKRILSKVYGFGKKKKDTPEVLLNLSRDVRDKINAELATLEVQLGVQSDHSMDGEE